MSVVKFNNSTVLPSWSNIMDSFFDESLFDNKHVKMIVPPANVDENEDNFVMKIAAPGLTKKDFKIELNQNLMTISSEKQEEKEEKMPTTSRKEYSYSSFKRSFSLPENIHQEGIEANYENGELVIKLPKTIHAKVLSKSIQIS